MRVMIKEGKSDDNDSFLYVRIDINNRDGIRLPTNKTIFF